MEVWHFGNAMVDAFYGRPLGLVRADVQSNQPQGERVMPELMPIFMDTLSEGKHQKDFGVQCLAAHFGSVSALPMFGRLLFGAR